MATDLEIIASLIRPVHDFPKPGVLFRDITPLIGSPAGLRAVTAGLLNAVPGDIDVVAGIESRGFIFGVPLALELGVGFVPIRKPNKLPGPVYSQPFDLEYGSSTLSIHQDSLQPGQRVLLVDDLLATGGTLVAGAQLIDQVGADTVHVSVVIELTDLGGRAKLAAQRGIVSVTSLISY
ncbi:MAG: adenine phosphoribosyltransferase [Propionibacteriaceae bacterium]|jgi:adenine phosphoribosyltransferase|nr:adenine phosphoribosyltransferase [Propionibacteriaceae bacterium]